MSILHLLRENLSNKQNDLERLRDCKRELKAYQQEFREYERFCVSPDLSAKTWQGKLAQAFDELRNDGILVSYQNLENTQLNHIITLLSQKIQDIESELSSLKASIKAETKRELERAKENK